MLLMQGGQAALARTLRALAPLSLSALLLTLVLLFGLQGEQIMRQPIVIPLFQRGAGLLAEPQARRGVVRGRTFSADWG